MSKKNEFRTKKGFWSRVKEMIGRTSDDTLWGKVKLIWKFYSSKQTVDYSKVKYALARAIYYASKVKDRIDGTEYGEKFLLGAVYGKPIVNSSTAFIIKSPLQIECEDDYTKNEVNRWLKENHTLMVQAIRNSLRDGDSYPTIDQDNGTRLIAPEYVDKIVDPLNVNKVLGYDISYYVKDDSGDMQQNYLLEYRKEGIKVYKIDGNNKVELSEKAITFDQDQPLPIVHFANEPEPNALYGNSEYQSCYTLMMNYHAVLESAIQGNIYNSTPVPYITGIENMQEFKETNGVLEDDGTYKIDWDNTKLMLGGKTTTFGVVQATDMTEGANKLLNLLFWGICQTSETPEFVMGNAVASSNASVDSQMPVMVSKAKRKQGIFTKPVIELVKLAMWYLAKEDTKIIKDIDFSIIWSDVTETDDKLNLEKAKLMLDGKLASKETIAKIAGLDDWTNDVSEEVKKANEEQQTQIDRELSLFPQQGNVNANKGQNQNNNQQNQ